MFPDGKNTLIRQQNDFPGNIGDSCWETSNWQHSCDSLGIKCEAGLPSFITLTGFVRHETAPPDWRESDFSEDQGRALFYGAAKNFSCITS